MAGISTTESLMRNRAETFDGWTKGNGFRMIRLGNTKNCNEDGIIRNYNIKDNMNDVLKKYNIEEFNLKEISNNIEHSYELQLKEEIYKNLKRKMLPHAL